MIASILANPLVNTILLIIKQSAHTYFDWQIALPVKFSILEENWWKNAQEDALKDEIFNWEGRVKKPDHCHFGIKKNQWYNQLKTNQ